MKDVDNQLLESKLKRHKISFINNNGRITFGKPKTDFVATIGFVAIPLLFASAICYFLFLSPHEHLANDKSKAIGGIVTLFMIGIFCYNRIKSKKQANKSIKTLINRSIIIKEGERKYTFDSSNISRFVYTVEEIDEAVIEANLFLTDTDGYDHLILGFDDENEKYAENDLKWMAEYFAKYTGTSKTE